MGVRTLRIILYDVRTGVPLFTGISIRVGAGSGGMLSGYLVESLEFSNVAAFVAWQCLEIEDQCPESRASQNCSETVCHSLTLQVGFRMELRACKATLDCPEVLHQDAVDFGQPGMCNVCDSLCIRRAVSKIRNQFLAP